jgi:protein-tyrosine phosphatase
MKKHILFICLGNICRSPSAEAVMNGLIKGAGLGNEIDCDSAGILNYHAGEPADERMQTHANKRGYVLTSISRQINPKKDFDLFDIIIGMDDQNIKSLKNLARTDDDLGKIYKITDYCRYLDYDLIPDPYYGGERGFDLVLDILEDACKGLLEFLRNEK